jgi:hypothetical protein
VRWWLDNRSDKAGWTIYKCTWEAGEDNSPRLDPHREGDHVISEYARPVELQAAMADAAATLAFFASEIRSSPSPHSRSAGDGKDGLTTDIRDWRSVEHAARRRVQQLWDPKAGRFRDWDVRRQGFLEPAAANDYWGTDPRRFSPLALTPLLFGQTTARQAAALRREIEHYTGPPWCEWPSWSYVVLEAASEAGWYDFAGRLAYEVVRRVYAENDRRDLHESGRSMPGVAREYWPLQPRQWSGSEGYGWGATTASFVIRQLCGFYEAGEADRCVFRLAPAFPPEMIDGRELGVGPLQYRGLVLNLFYRPGAEGRLEVELDLPNGAAVQVTDEETGGALLDDRPDVVRAFKLQRGRSCRVELIP